MAIKAGRVGVAPSQVDMAGNVVGAGSGYTKAEADAKFATKTEADAKFATKTELSGKVPASQLQANSKDFYFAYDATSQKYGYKAGSDGDFVPFSSGGSGGIGWVTPPNLTHDTLVFPEGSAYIAGGYYSDTTAGLLYIDLVCSKLGGSGGVDITGFPSHVGTVKVLAFVNNASAQSEPDDYFSNYTSVNSYDCGSAGVLSLSSWSALGYMRIIGIAKLPS